MIQRCLRAGRGRQ